MINFSFTAVVSVIVVLVLSMPVEALTWQEFFQGSNIEFIDKNPDNLPACTVDPASGGAPSTGGPAVGLSGGTVPVNFSLGVSAAERHVNLIKALMADFGFTAEQAAGVVGNFMVESGGINLPPNVNEYLGIAGSGPGPPRPVRPGVNTGGYGWAQWTGPRKTAMVNFAIQGGYMSGWNVSANDGANYAYLKKDLSTGYTSTVSALKATSTPEAAANAFQRVYERPRVLDGKRAVRAREALNEYLKAGGTATPITTPTPGGGTATTAPAAGATTCGNGTNPTTPVIVSTDGTAFPLMGGKAVVKNPTIFRNGTTDRAGHPYIAYDILANPGTPVSAYMDGVVNYIGNDRCGGRLITIYNQQQDLTISYMHNTLGDYPPKGKIIKAGERISSVGTAADGCGTPHVHVDAIKGKTRIACSRLNCPPSSQALFVDLGPQLFQNFQKMP